MVQERREILRLAIVQNERGSLFFLALILLFFTSLFLFSIVLWHDSVYMQYDSQELYYWEEAKKTMMRHSEELGVLKE